MLRAFDGLWRVYARPWDAFADVSAVAGACGDAFSATRRQRFEAVQRFDAGRLLDCVEGIVDTVKRDLDTRFLPAFVASEAYAVFVRERLGLARAAFRAGWVRAAQNIGRPAAVASVVVAVSCLVVPKTALPRNPQKPCVL